MPVYVVCQVSVLQSCVGRPLDLAIRHLESEHSYQAEFTAKMAHLAGSTSLHNSSESAALFGILKACSVISQGAAHATT